MNTRAIKVKSSFDKTERYLGKHYDIELRANIIRELLGDIQNARILDLGCGDGSLSLQFASTTNHLVLVDLSSNMLNIAKQHTPSALKDHIEYINTDVSYYNPSEQFDIILCVGLLAHVESYDVVIKKISQLLKPNGCCIIQITDNDKIFGKLLNVYYGIRDRIRMSRRYSLHTMDLAGLVSSARRNKMILINKRQYISPLPGMGVLPNEWLYRYERFTLNHSFLARLGSETLSLYQKLP